MILPNSLRKELEEKRTKLIQLIEDQKDSSITPKRKAVIKRYKQVRTMQSREARIHAARGETPLSKIHYVPHAVDKKRFQKVLEGIENAWNFGLIAYHGSLDDDFLKRLAWELDSEFFAGDTAYFRRPDIIIPVVGAWGHVPPEAIQEMPNELYRYVTHNNEFESYSIPEQAFLMNFHLGRIQPFPDCNKRLGKLVQNLHLHLYNYPPATVLEGEVEFYNHLFGNAIRGFKDREEGSNYSDQETEFFEFLGTRVNNNLNSILDGSRYVPQQIIPKLKNHKVKTRKFKNAIGTIRRPLHTIKR